MENKLKEEEKIIPWMCHASFFIFLNTFTSIVFISIRTSICEINKKNMVVRQLLACFYSVSYTTHVKFSSQVDSYNNKMMLLIEIWLMCKEGKTKLSNELEFRKFFSLCGVTRNRIKIVFLSRLDFIKTFARLVCRVSTSWCLPKICATNGERENSTFPWLN